MSLKRTHIAAALLLTFGLTTSVPGIAQGRLLTAPEAFQVVKVLHPAPDSITLVWAIAPGYAVYKKRVQVTQAGHHISVISVAMPRGQQLDPPSLHMGRAFTNRFPMRIHYSMKTGAKQATLNIRLGGCHHAQPEVCLPPYTYHIPLHLGT